MQTAPTSPQIVEAINHLRKALNEAYGNQWAYTIWGYGQPIAHRNASGDMKPTVEQPFEPEPESESEPVVQNA